ncbi:zinc-dependent alcohol dehydrogenase [Geodermatophilus sp. SYSU D00815]
MTTTRRAKALWFTAARRAELLDEDVPPPSTDQVTIRALTSLVSAGTEMLVYRGQIPAGDDLGLETCRGSFGFPVKYAYQVVGEVVDAGTGTGYSPGQVVFARHPHQDLFTMRNDPILLFHVPDGLAPERAAFANLLDVALNCTLDVPVRHGDCVVVHGQGVVGSFCAQLARRTAGTLVVVDAIPGRRENALGWGADAAVAPEDAAGVIDELTKGRGADISIEASGAPAALQAAISTTGQEGTVAVVSFFGGKTVPLVLSPEFHYRRQRVISSQVSTIGSGLQPRWTMERRMETVFGLLAQPWLQTTVSRRVPFGEAAEAYRVLDEHPEQEMGVLLSYDGATAGA